MAVGASLAEKDMADTAREIMAAAKGKCELLLVFWSLLVAYSDFLLIQDWALFPPLLGVA